MPVIFRHLSVCILIVVSPVPGKWKLENNINKIMLFNIYYYIYQLLSYQYLNYITLKIVSPNFHVISYYVPSILILSMVSAVIGK